MAYELTLSAGIFVHEARQDNCASSTRLFENLDESDYLGRGEIDFLVFKEADEPKAQVSTGKFMNRADAPMGQRIAVLGCSPDELHSILKFITDRSNLFVAAGLEAICSISDEFNAPMEAGGGVDNREADVVVAVYKSSENTCEDAFELLKLTHGLPHRLPKGFTLLFSKAIELLSLSIVRS